MLDPHVELTLKDISRRLLTLMNQVRDGEQVDNVLLEKMNEISERVFINHTAGYAITNEELEYMIELVSLLEMRTTLL